MVRCNHCGEPLTLSGIEALNFYRDGSDKWDYVCLHECDNEAVYVDLSTNWTGDEQDDDDPDKSDCIRCPKCHKFPFKNKEIQTYVFVRVVVFDEKEHAPWRIED